MDLVVLVSDFWIFFVAFLTNEIEIGFMDDVIPWFHCFVLLVMFSIVGILSACQLLESSNHKLSHDLHYFCLQGFRFVTLWEVGLDLAWELF